MKELEIVRHVQMDGLSLFFDTVDYRTPHFHAEWELIWILEGELSVTCGSENALARPGQLLLFSPQQNHEFHKTERPCTFLCVQIQPGLFQMPDSLRANSVFPEAYLTAEELSLLKSRIRRAAEAYLERQEQYPLLCIGELALGFHLLLNRMPCRTVTPEEAASNDRRNARLAALIRFVDENYMHKIRLADFAQAQGVSLSYLSHFIKDALNQNYQDYVNSVRVNAACQRIAEGESKMLNVCLESGFSDYRYFSRAFKRQFGMTPEQYSRRPRKPEAAGTVVRHSLHSLERFYDREQSLTLLKQLPED